MQRRIKQMTVNQRLLIVLHSTDCLIEDRPLNHMCNNCINGQCIGTSNTVYDGCVYKITSHATDNLNRRIY